MEGEKILFRGLSIIHFKQKATIDFNKKNVKVPIEINTNSSVKRSQMI